MSDALKTIKSSIIEGMCDSSVQTGLTISSADFLVPALIESIFHPSVRWAVKEYLEELEGEDE